MSEEYKKLNGEELTQAAGGKSGLASLGDGPVWHIKGLTTEFLPLKSEASGNSVDLAQLKNGDIVQAQGGRVRISDDPDGNRAITYTKVYVPSLKQTGWVDSAYLG